MKLSDEEKVRLKRSCEIRDMDEKEFEALNLTKDELANLIIDYIIIDSYDLYEYFFPLPFFEIGRKLKLKLPESLKRALEKGVRVNDQYHVD